MRHQKHAEMQPRLDISEKSQHLRLHRHIERRDRLVRDEHFWMQRERAGNADPLALAAAELMWKTLCGGGVEPDEAEQRLRLLAGFGGRGAVDDGAFRDNVDDALPRIERSVEILKHHLHAFADRAELAARELGDIRAAKQNFAAVDR